MPVQATIPIVNNSSSLSQIVEVTVTLTQTCNPFSSVTYTDADSEVSFTQDLITLDSDFGTCSNITGKIIIDTIYDGQPCTGTIDFIPTFIAPAVGELEITYVPTGEVIGTKFINQFEQNESAGAYRVRLTNIGTNPITITSFTEDSDPGGKFNVVLPTTPFTILPAANREVGYTLNTGVDGNFTGQYSVGWEDVDVQEPQNDNFTLQFSVRKPCQLLTIEARIDEDGAPKWKEFASDQAKTLGLISPGRDVKFFGTATDFDALNKERDGTNSFGSLKVTTTITDVERDSTWTVSNGSGGTLVLEELIPRISEYFRASIRFGEPIETSPGIFSLPVVFGVQDHILQNGATEKKGQRYATPQKGLQIIGKIAGQTFNSGIIITPNVYTPSFYVGKTFGDGYQEKSNNFFGGLRNGLFTQQTIANITGASQNEVTCEAIVWEVIGGAITANPLTRGFVKYYFTITCP